MGEQNGANRAYRSEQWVRARRSGGTIHRALRPLRRAAAYSPTSVATTKGSARASENRKQVSSWSSVSSVTSFDARLISCGTSIGADGRPHAPRSLPLRGAPLESSCPS
eukprot:scaffold206712_cov35-Tisochrysis_lutea.AAC.1